MKTDAEGRPGWKGFFRRHSGAVLVFAAACALLLALAVYVFWWFVGDAQSTGLVPSSLGLWSMHHALWFIIYLVFWEIVLVGIPAGIGAAIAWAWWRRLPSEERTGYRFGRRSRAAGGSGGVSLLFFIAFCIKIYLDGNWYAPISTFTLDYVAGSMILILVWVAVIIGIPGAIAAVWWVRRELSRAD